MYVVMASNMQPTPLVGHANLGSYNYIRAGPYSGGGGGGGGGGLVCQTFNTAGFHQLLEPQQERSCFCYYCETGFLF